MPGPRAACAASVPFVELLDSAGAEFERAVRALPADAWEWPTPCDMPVRELVEHVVVGNRFTALLLAGVDRDEARRQAAGDPLGDDPVAAVIGSTQEQAAAFARCDPAQLVPGPKGDVPVETFLRFRLIDLAVHAWDLRRAARLDEALDEQLVRALLALVEPHLDELIAYGAYGEGPSGTVDVAAPPQQRLLDAFGRRP